MNFRHMFPLGKAYGQAFCNRVDETKKLVGNIESGKHTFLVAPRRYGKSSLCEHAFEQIKLPWSKIDFHLAINEKDVERILINGITELIGKSIGSIDKMFQIIKKLAKKLQPKFVISSDNLKLELAFSNDSISSEASKQMDISVNSISRAVSALIEKDYIEKTDQKYRLIVPAYKQLLHI